MFEYVDQNNSPTLSGQNFNQIQFSLIFLFIYYLFFGMILLLNAICFFFFVMKSSIYLYNISLTICFSKAILINRIYFLIIHL